MKRRSLKLRHPALELSLVVAVLAVGTSPAFAGSPGGKFQKFSRQLGGRALNIGKMNIQPHVQNRMKPAVRSNGFNAILNGGKQFIKQPQLRGSTKSQLNNNRGLVNGLLNSKAKDILAPKAKDLLRNSGKSLAKKHFQDFGKKNALQLKSLALSNLLNHGNNYEHKLRHQNEHNHIVRLDWCKRRPRACHWWYDTCRPIRYYAPEHCISYDWTYVTCSTDWHGVVQEARWYLGMKATLLPGVGLGVESVTPGSPADAIGLESGMVIIEANGAALVDETVMPAVIASSGGILNIKVIAGEGQPPQSVTLQLQRVVTQSF